MRIPPEKINAYQGKFFEEVPVDDGPEYCAACDLAPCACDEIYERWRDDRIVDWD